MLLAMWDESSLSAGAVLRVRPSLVYDQAAFHSFLAVEQQRAERSRRSLVLVLVTVRQELGVSGSMSPQVATKVFSALAVSVRDVDFVGWYKAERIAGAVLAQRADPLALEACSRIRDRVAHELRRDLRSDVASQLRVRVAHLRPRPRGDCDD
jgi:hypothetical protein